MNRRGSDVWGYTGKRVLAWSCRYLDCKIKLQIFAHSHAKLAYRDQSAKPIQKSQKELLKNEGGQSTHSNRPPALKPLCNRRKFTLTNNFPSCKTKSIDRKHVKRKHKVLFEWYGDWCCLSKGWAWKDSMTIGPHSLTTAFPASLPRSPSAKWDYDLKLRVKEGTDLPDFAASTASHSKWRRSIRTLSTRLEAAGPGLVQTLELGTSFKYSSARLAVQNET